MTPNLQKVNWPHEDDKQYLMFIDSEVILNAALTWNGDNVTAIDFELNNRVKGEDKRRYKFCGVTYCSRAVITVIHLIYDKQSPDKVNFNHKSSISLPVNSSHEFRFKIYDDRCPIPEDLNCNLNTGTPKTKDGSIIISQ